ncbi:hypothetical protein RhiirA5_367629 [Rhizophagus irregularis]|uniref:Uncharacterized protein n=1 Tax=Rhizophagus irregularis TaxID=588596 RepID=A0A2N0NQP1_9GLOM|nr:hypothetical protein RhiirA5_367629 [Rhizophagus irregularis]
MPFPPALQSPIAFLRFFPVIGQGSYKNFFLSYILFFYIEQFIVRLTFKRGEMFFKIFG